MHYFLGIVVPASVLLPLGAAAYSYRQLGKPHKIFLFYLVVAGITDVMASYMAHHRTNNLWLLHIYTAIEAVFMLWFYKEVLNDKRLKTVIPYLMVLFPIICLVNVIWGQGFDRYNTYTRPVEALMLMFMGIAYFLERSQEPVVARKGTATAVTWINAGILFYMSASLFFFTFSNFLHQGQFFTLFITICHGTFVVIMYLLFMIGFLKCRS